VECHDFLGDGGLEGLREHREHREDRERSERSERYERFQGARGNKRSELCEGERVEPAVRNGSIRVERG
jgi:hypothetical protein